LGHPLSEVEEVPGKFGAFCSDFQSLVSGKPFHAHRVMRHVFLQVRKDQKQFEHAVSLVRIRLVSAFLQIFDHGERIRKQPFEAAGSDRFASAEILQSAVSSYKRLVKKMIEAELFGNEPYRNRAGTPRPAAWGGRRGVHDLLHFLGLNFVRGIEKPSIFPRGQWVVRVKRQ
jgi:hypothetical protein